MLEREREKKKFLFLLLAAGSRHKSAQLSRQRRAVWCSHNGRGIHEHDMFSLGLLGVVDSEVRE